jgi:PIN domain nuclease of toxin-antitoxin system
MFSENLLIDTQSFIWFVENNPKLPDSVRKTMENKDNDLFVSIASLWEAVIKSSMRKLELKRDITETINCISEVGFSILPIKPQHLIILHGLKQIHRDPFDRIIISQAISENFTIVSSDSVFRQYELNNLICI